MIISGKSSDTEPEPVYAIISYLESCPDRASAFVLQNFPGSLLMTGHKL